MYLKDFRAVLFDLDGTLIRLDIDYEKEREEVRDYFCGLGVPGDWHFKPILTKIDEAVSFLVENRDYGEEERERLKKGALDIIDRYERGGVEKAEIIPGAREALEYLHRYRTKTGIFSRTSKRAVELAIRKFGFPEFGVVLGRENSERVKPDPQQIEICQRILDIGDRRFAVVGDHIYDMMAGKSAGAYCVGVLTGVSSEPSLRERGADVVVESVANLESIVIES